MTEKLYYIDSYIKQFSAVVVSCEKAENGFKVVLDKTAFFPEGGGQKPDTGFIGDVRVYDVQVIDSDVYHFVEKELNISEEYVCKLDWDQRFLRMQSHSGEHIVSGVVHSMFGYDNVGFHMEEDYVTVDFNGELTREQLNDVEEKVNRVIYRNIDIECYFPDENAIERLDYRSKLDLKENVRLVKIGDTDLCACCAPHVRKTGEIGVVKILDFMRHRGGVRIVMKSGLKALLDYREKYESVYDVSVMLSSKQHEIAGFVDKKLNEIDTLQRKFNDFKMSIAENDKNNLVFMGDAAIFVASFYDVDMMRELANYGMTQKEICVIFSGNEESGFSYVAGSLSFDMNKFAKHFNSALNGRGGGRGTMIQGKVTALKQDIINYFNSLDLKSI